MKHRAAPWVFAVFLIAVFAGVGVWTLAAVSIVAIVWGAVALALVAHRRLHHRRDELIARAEQQHAWFMDGDSRAAVYGEYPPAY